MSLLTVFGFACWTIFGVLKGEWALMIRLPEHKTVVVAKTLEPAPE